MLVLVEALALASTAALRYGRSLRPGNLRAVHFVLDSEHAERLAKKWQLESSRWNWSTARTGGSVVARWR